MKDAIGIPLVSLEPQAVSLFFSFIEKNKYAIHGEPTFSWEALLGINSRENPSEFISRAMLASSQQFNFWQNKKETTRNSRVWKWTTDKDDMKFLRDMNLPEQRAKIISAIRQFIYANYNHLSTEVAKKSFWLNFNFIANLGNKDIVAKKTVLLKIICDSAGFPVYNANEWGFGCVDYNLLAVFKELNLFDIPIGTASKKEIDDIRCKIYRLCHEATKEFSIPSEKLDSFLIDCGRDIRSQRGEFFFPQVEGEFHY